jgi:hypothetical protein
MIKMPTMRDRVLKLIMQFPEDDERLREVGTFVKLKLSK